MLISPHGTAKRSNPIKQAGFTLVEVLMSLLIVGLMTGLVVLNLPESEDPVETQAKLLVTRLQTASQTSMISNQAIGIEFTDDGYRAVRFIGDEWETIERFEYDMDSVPIVEITRNDEKIDLEKAQESGIPVIRYDSTGLATPFELSIDVYGTEIRIEGGADGSVKLVPSDLSQARIFDEPAR